MCIRDRFKAGFVIAMVLLLVLAALARWKARDEDMTGVRRARPGIIGRTLLVAAPALVLPFLIRSLVGGGIATATEVSAIAAPVASSAVISAGEWPRLRISGNSAGATVAMSDTLDPEIPETRNIEPSST